MERIKPRTLSGFMELLPAPQMQMERIMEILRRTYSLYGFTPLDTPAIESAEVLAYIPDDRTHAENDIMGVSVFDLPEDSPVMMGTREALRKMQLI